MKSNYAGETFSKKLARYETWRCVNRVWRGRLSEFHAAFLASEFGGDIETLRAMGVPDSLMFAVDVDTGALSMCKTRRGESVNYVNSSIVEWAEKRCSSNPGDLPRAAVFLDSCRPLGTELLQEICGTARYVNGSCSVLCVNFLKGRENPFEFPRASRSFPSSVGNPNWGRTNAMGERRHVWRKWLERILAGGDSDVHGCLQLMNSLYPKSPPLSARVCLIAEAMRLTSRVRWVPKLAIEYKGNKSPMLTVVFESLGAECGGYWSMPQFNFITGDLSAECLLLAAHRERHGSISNEILDSWGVRRCDLDMAKPVLAPEQSDTPGWRATGMEEYVPSLKFSETDSKSYVKHMCLTSADERIPQALAVSRGQLAAWKAVETMKRKRAALTLGVESDRLGVRP